MPNVDRPDRLIANMADRAALPRKNGELVFEALWEGRVFGMAVVLNERRLYAWDEFRDQLIAEIAVADAQGSPATYYERWLASFERLLVEKGVVAPAELETRTAEFESGARD